MHNVCLSSENEGAIRVFSFDNLYRNVLPHSTFAAVFIHLWEDISLCLEDL